MERWFEIEAAPKENLVQMRMGGFFDADSIHEMRRALVAAIAELTCSRNEHATLCDITAMKIQPQVIVEAFSSLVGSPELRSRKLAFVTGATLARLQARRLTDRPGVEFFFDRNAAMAWVMAPQRQAA